MAAKVHQLQEFRVFQTDSFNTVFMMMIRQVISTMVKNSVDNLAGINFLSYTCSV